MKFTKMEGAGNDYVYVDCTSIELEKPGVISKRVSDRHFGIGSDGLILIKGSDKADFFMEMYNSDGSQGEMCGNGIRCVGKYVYDNGLTNKTEIAVDTLAGIKYLSLHVGADNKVKTVTVNMGAPILEAKDIPMDVQELKNYSVKDSENKEVDNSATFSKKCDAMAEDVKAAVMSMGLSNPVIAEDIEVDGRTYQITGVSMGNPHGIIYLDNDIDIKEFPIEKIGPKVENHKAFPRRVNAEFIQVVDRQNLNMRVWERGAGETFACGTGACASLVATVLNGLCDTTATLHLLGGDLKITWDTRDNVIYMEGPATTVFTGEIEL